MVYSRMQTIQPYLNLYLGLLQEYWYVALIVIVLFIGIISYILYYLRKRKSKQVVQGSTQSTSSSLLKTFFQSLSGKRVDQDVLKELEAILLKADVGMQVTHQLLAGLKPEGEGESLKTQLLQRIEKMVSPYVKPLEALNIAPFSKNEYPTMMMMVGLNGTGKTTTIAKLAYVLKNQYKVGLIAGDVFRAGAVEQLEKWAHRLSLPMVKPQGKDMAAVAYRGYTMGLEKKLDVILLDTAGRQHTNVNLMNELKKTITVLKKRNDLCPQEIIIVLDGNVGQNALNQVHKFGSLLPLSGIIVTKLDGISFGGSILNLINSFQLPIIGIGVGEKVEDFQTLNPKIFAERFVNV